MARSGFRGSLRCQVGARVLIIEVFFLLVEEVVEVVVGVVFFFFFLLVVEEVGTQISPPESSNIRSWSALECIHAPQRVCENFDASSNIWFISVTLDTSHFERSPLNDDAEANI